MNSNSLFSKIRNSRSSRIICAFLALNLIIELVTPTMAMALTAGPSSPEFSSFEPVATTDMVNDFTGDFTYNIPVINVPGPDGGDYAMSLAYHAGASSEEEASWVGFGWTLNPGAINRNKRGFPDEFNNVPVETYNKSKANFTQNANMNLNIEISSKDGKPDLNAGNKAEKGIIGFSKKYGTSGASLSQSVRFNNYSGFSVATRVSANFDGSNLNFENAGGRRTLGFGFGENSEINVKLDLDKEKSVSTNLKGGIDFGKNQLKKLENKIKVKLGKIGGGIFSVAVKVAEYYLTNYVIHSYEIPALNYSVAKNVSASWNFNGSYVTNPTNFPYGRQISVVGGLNIQASRGTQTFLASGFMNSSNANSNSADDKLYDYQIEKQTTFMKNDKNIGIPHNNSDIFIATGNRVIGGFKLQHEKIGTFYPNFHKNITKIRQLGVEIGVGATFQIGLNIGVGRQTTSVDGKWIYAGGASATNEPVFSTTDPIMRFTNDFGGEVDYNSVSSTDDIPHARIDVLGRLILHSDMKFDLTDPINAEKNGRTSNIEYIKSGSPSLITGLKITTKDGGKSNYTLPVYTKNEAELSVGLNNFQDGEYLVAGSLNYNNPLQNSTVVGSKTAQQYATSYLLQSNTTFNYVDVNGNGTPDDADFGGWTKFDYKLAYGGSGDWYRYRSPYNGLLYNSGRMIDKSDQVGSMSSGEKEVYYLKSVQTKSHIAFFITNKTTLANFTTNFPFSEYPYLYNGNATSPIASVTTAIQGSGIGRLDGVDAAAVNSLGLDDAAYSLTAKGTHSLEKLEKIVLFAKADLSTPLTTTFFEYDYSLCKGIPNSLATNASTSGKLTLKRVWTESNGVNRSQIAPYQFTYEYFNNYAGEVVTKYPFLAYYNTLPNNDANQNPYYKPEQLDPWGNYQLNGAQRYKNMQLWVSQLTPTPSQHFDPAAWQLKRIQLPSGGEIHIHYEQKDYMSVQDKNPMAMVSLLSDDNKNEYTSDESVYAINLADLDVPNDANYSTNLANYVDSLEKHFLTNRNKLYFKMLYSLQGSDIPAVNTNNDRYEYVAGYTVVNKITTSGSNILLHLGDIRKEVYTGGLTVSNTKQDKTLPRYVCNQVLANNGGKNLGLNALNYKDEDYTPLLYPNGNDVTEQKVVDVARGHVLPNTINMLKDWLAGKVENIKKQEACKALNFKYSYFKLPTLFAKKGGGIRVKRILTYDKGIETGDAMMFGSEYIYQEKNGLSSGVATNEPAAMHEENALVTLLERSKQKFMDKLLNGKDIRQQEGPLGENLLPSAEIVHSTIIIKNIHSGISTTGYAVNEYYTTKDFPMEVDYTAIKKKPGGGGTFKKFVLELPLGAFGLTIQNGWLTQGYLFKLNDMNGKIKSKATYAGNYDPLYFNESVFTTRTTYNYSKSGDKVPALVMDPTTGEIKSSFLSPGTEEDYCVFSSNVKEISCDFYFETDCNVTILALYPTCSPNFKFSYKSINQHVTNKVVSQTSHLLSTTTINDGVAQTTENIAFDKYTGEPVLTRTFDGYMSPQEQLYTQNGGTSKHKGYYYSLNIPASWVYPSMGPISTSTNNTNQLVANAGNVVTYGNNALFSALVAAGSNTMAWAPTVNPLQNVVNASATTYTNNWFASGSLVDFVAPTNTVYLSTSTYASANKYFYPLRTYAYRDNVKDANVAGTGKIYEGGITTTNFSFFNWLNPSSVANVWYSDSKVTKYSPYGYPVEEEDVLAIKSSARYGYNNTLPVTVAQNAGFNETKFIDFEYGGISGITSAFAHTGKNSFDLSAAPNYVFVSSYPLSTNILTQKGLSVRFWLKSSLSTNPTSPNYGLKNPNPQTKVLIGGQPFNMQAIAQTGDWTLYNAEIKNFYGLTANNYNIQVSYNIVSGSSEQVLVDDFRIQPLDASMNCSVYYADNKLAAKFDDQHFAVLYEYNNKGQLTRKSIETERGKKTLQEQQYNTPLINR